MYHLHNNEPLLFYDVYITKSMETIMNYIQQLVEPFDDSFYRENKWFAMNPEYILQPVEQTDNSFYQENKCLTMNTNIKWNILQPVEQTDDSSYQENKWLTMNPEYVNFVEYYK